MLFEPAKGISSSTSHLDCEVDAKLAGLVQALVLNDPRRMRENYKALYKMGSVAIPAIKEAVFRADWSSVKRREEIRYISGLMNLLNDIDEAEAGQVALRLKNDRCNPVVKRIVDAICSFTLNDYQKYEVRGVHILEHKGLASEGRIRRLLGRWLQYVPHKDLTEIERICILPRDEYNFSGRYMPIFFQITLVWDNPYSKIDPFFWMNEFLIKKVLYHEIGHHAHRHTFGQLPDQEDEANDYAARRIVDSHPFMKGLLLKISQLLTWRSSRDRVEENEEVST